MVGMFCPPPHPLPFRVGLRQLPKDGWNENLNHPPIFTGPSQSLRSYLGFTPHSDSKQLKSAKNKISSLYVISRVFPGKFHQNHFSFRNCMCFIFKMCQTVAGIKQDQSISRIFNLIFGRFLPLGPIVLVAVAVAHQQQLKSALSSTSRVESVIELPAGCMATYRP